MADMDDPKTAMHHYLQQCREALVWKLDGAKTHPTRAGSGQATADLHRALTWRRARWGTLSSTSDQHTSQLNERVSDSGFDEGQQIAVDRLGLSDRHAVWQSGQT